MNNRASHQVIAIILLLAQLVCAHAWGRDGTEAVHILGFAESLFEEGDYFRAIGEYKRYIFLYPTETFIEKATLRIAESYFRAKRWPESISACDQFMSRFPGSLLYLDALYLKGRAEKLDKRYNDSLRTFDLLINANIPSYGDKAVYQKALIMLERADWRGTRDYLLQVPKESPLNSTAAALLAELVKAEELPHKSPETAGLLSAVLPGAGHLYTERPQDALVAFLLNGLFIWGAVELIQHDNYVAGGILTFFELGWYGGTIYSAVNSAHKYNRHKQEQFIRNLNDKFSLSFNHDREALSILFSKRF